MRSEALLFFAATQLAMLFELTPIALTTLVALCALAIAVKALGDRRAVDLVSVATILAAVASSLLIPWAIRAEEAAGADFMVELKLDGRRIEGQALKWTKREVVIYGRDGRLWEFPASKGSDYRKTASRFTPYSQAEVRSELLTEFGKRYDVSGTGHYLVVHPRGQKDLWAQRFEDIFRAFSHYFSTRGFNVRKPPCPLVAVVFPSQGLFRQYAAKEGFKLSSDVLGYYSPQSNRVLLFNAARGNSPQPWHVTFETIIHEAAHQAAFNTGVHSRRRMPPRWVAEGLGTMFEARGVWGSRRHFQQVDRLNRHRFDRFQKLLSQRPAGRLAEFITSERMFDTQPDTAYAEAWALSFFLAETRPRDYARYLAATSSGRGGLLAPPSERLQVFTEIFGDDLTMLEAQYLRFHRQLAEKL